MVLRFVSVSVGRAKEEHPDFSVPCPLPAKPRAPGQIANALPYLLAAFTNKLLGDHRAIVTDPRAPSPPARPGRGVPPGVSRITDELCDQIDGTVDFLERIAVPCRCQ